jgi:hypothetical protein
MARNYRKEYDDYHSSEEQKKRRAARNKARRKALKNGTVKKGDSKEVHHPGANRTGDLPSRTRVISKASNRRQQPKRS